MVASPLEDPRDISTERAVLVMGGGPTGLMLAGELALAGVDVAIVERRTNQHVDGSRARGLHSCTIEMLDQRGIADRFLDAGQVAQVQGFAGIHLDISDLPVPHPYGLALWQRDFERVLAGWVDELGVPVHRGVEVTGVDQDDDAAYVKRADGTAIRAEYVVGCDGGRSVVRESAGIDFVGLDASTSWLIAEVDMSEEPPLGFHHDSAGTHALGPAADGRSVGVLITEAHLRETDAPTLEDLRNALVNVFGIDYGLRSATWISRFTDRTRQAVSYRRGRVLVAGDAAHIHPPQGGQGLNTGVQDAVNLGWKLAQVVKGTTPDSLLDTYHAERHPIGERVLHNTMAQVALGRPDERHRALRETVTELLSMKEPRQRIAAMLAGLDIRYDLGGEHPLVGRRIPDLDVETLHGRITVFSLLHDARPILLNLGAPDTAEPLAEKGRVRIVNAKYAGPLELPLLGEVAAPPAVVIRPDGYVAWAGEVADESLNAAMRSWFGAPAVD